MDVPPLGIIQTPRQRREESQGDHSAGQRTTRLRGKPSQTQGEQLLEMLRVRSGAKKCFNTNTVLPCIHLVFHVEGYPVLRMSACRELDQNIYRTASHSLALPYGFRLNPDHAMPCISAALQLTDTLRSTSLILDSLSKFQSRNYLDNVRGPYSVAP